ncbi:nucleoporin Nup43 [Schistocerca gregaria]|uniref:nucleoporin Nup43 n=1 Tax=Schistocerca gregaria TaxID=7010 RepID=UPI00211EC794|nr:nucleoporin Nup43 [Schistocerca gregaria]
MDDVQAVFVGEKINKVRWKPEALSSSSYFVTGSWDEQICHLALWSYASDEDESYSIPAKLRTVPNCGDITEIKFVNSSTCVVATSGGSVRCFRVDVRYPQSADLREVTSWEKLHFLPYGTRCSCTSLSCFEEDIATVGEDGKLNLLTLRQQKPVHVVDEADSSTLRCVCFLKHSEILTGNLRGILKIWDLKSSTVRPTMSFTMPHEQVSASCVVHHPTQRHLVLAGGEEGALVVWDLRHSIYPITVLNAHSSSIKDLEFHPDRPEHLFSCSADGGIWHWKTEGSRVSQLTKMTDTTAEESPWVSGAVAKQRIQIYALMPQLHKPINSLDVSKANVIFGCDNEAVYISKNTSVYQ